MLEIPARYPRMKEMKETDRDVWSCSVETGEWTGTSRTLMETLQWGNNTTVNTIQYSEYTHHQWHNPQPLSPRPQQVVHPARSAIFMAADGHMVNEHNQQVNTLGEATDQV